MTDPRFHPLSARLLQLILNSAVDFAILSTDLDGRVTTWNEGARRIFGYDEAEMLGDRAHKIFTGADIAERRPEIEMEQALAEGRAINERWHERKDGSQFWASGLMMPLRKEGGPAEGFVKILSDRTAERQAGGGPHGTEERFHTLLENLPHKVWFLTNEGAVPFVNRGWKEYTGFAPKDGSRWPSLVHPDDFEAHMKLRGEAIAAGLPYELRTRIRRADGVYRWQLARVVPLRNEQERIFAWLGSWTDIDDIVRTETALEAALKRQELLTREASHRVKNSLQIVASLLALQARAAKHPEVTRALKDAGARIATVAQVHDRLWRRDEVRTVDLAAFLGDLCDDLGRTASSCRLVYDSTPVTASADLAVPLGLIVNELVTNAFKYACSAEGSEVRVQFGGKDDGSLRLEVSDRGPGLPEGTETGGGDSLGMKLVSGFVRQLRGELEVFSDSTGTRFAVQIPLDPADEEPTQLDAGSRSY